MKKSFLYGSLIALVGWIIFWGITYTKDPVPIIINESLKDSFIATCRIETDKAIATGVLLNTGYIITAAHAVDTNGNGKIDKHERDISLKFYDGKNAPYTIRGRAVFSGRIYKNDFAIIEQFSGMKSDISLATSLPAYGDPVYTIGMTKGKGPLITQGYQCWRNKRSTSRASVFVDVGNSGGGIFTRDQVLRGVVSQTLFTRRMAPVRTVFRSEPDKNGKRKLIYAYGDAIVEDHVAAWCEYVDVEIIRRVLKERRLLFLVDKQKESTNINWLYLQMAAQILGVLTCVTWFKEDLFS